MKNIEIILKKNIKKFGFISVEKFFNVVLYHDELGYYNNNKIIGKSGDFITAPEISQTFGEILSNSLLLNYSKIKKNKLVSFVELGPGRGFLTRDILRTLKKLNIDFFKKIDAIYFLEKSKSFFRYLKELDLSPSIIDDIGKVSENFNIIIANEFFDALPVNQYIFRKNKWYEIVICLDKNEKFKFSIAKNPTKINFCFPNNPPDGYIFEYSGYMINLLADICKKISSFGGIFILIDYARNKKSKQGTIESLKQHRKVDLFFDLGNCDISYKPDFELIKKISVNNNCKVFGPFTQSFFLQSYGINERINLLIKNNPKQKNELLLQKLRLIGDNYMGKIFKVLIITDTKYNYEFI